MIYNKELLVIGDALQSSSTGARVSMISTGCLTSIEQFCMSKTIISVISQVSGFLSDFFCVGSAFLSAFAGALASAFGAPFASRRSNQQWDQSAQHD